MLEQMRRYSEEYRREYDLEELPSIQETARIRSIKIEREYCASCKGLEECQYSGDDRGFKRRIIADNLNRFKKNHLYFGVEKCARRLEAERLEREQRGLEESNLPYPQPLRESQKRILEGLKRESYYIIGPHGSGKTNLLSHIGLKYLKEGLRVKYVSQPELLIELRVGSERYREQLRECKEVEVLLIDDWRGGENRYNEEQLWVILNHRELRGRVSIIGSRESIKNQSVRLRERLERYKVMINT